ncbi:hypothetical protein Q0Z83_111900 [Actinoplanes sichuanensis]|nr:hypothetical protein Q0Z83_111900 [Actinoplanes sichuanensis]
MASMSTAQIHQDTDMVMGRPFVPAEPPGAEREGSALLDEGLPGTTMAAVAATPGSGLPDPY